MCIDRLKWIVKDPAAAIAKAKKEKRFNTTLEILLINWAIIAIAIAIIPNVEGMIRTTAAVFVAIAGILGTIFFGYLVNLVFNVLGGKGKLFEGLTSITYAEFPIAVGLIVSSVLSVAPLVGAPIAVVASIVFTILGVVTFYRAVKEFFSTDVVTAWVGVWILGVGAALGFYLAVLPFLGSVLPPEIGPGFFMMGN